MQYRKNSIYLLSLMLLFTIVFVKPSKIEAGFADNYNSLYYDLSRLVYQANDTTASKQSIQDAINATHGKGKFKVIEAVNVNKYAYHQMSQVGTGYGTSTSRHALDQTGFKAMAVVAEGSGKLFIAFSGTNSGSVTDVNTARATLSVKEPGQAYQAQLFANFIYEKYSNYRGYKWYLTGHSLGGWLATNLYLDIRSATWLIPTDYKFKYGGPVGKKTISGVYTFNPLPMGKNQIPDVQWKANKDGLYNIDVKNLYINNEWLNGVYDMNTSQMDYIGTKGSINNENILHYSRLNYTPKGPLLDLAGYHLQAMTAQKDINAAHSLSRLGKYVGN